ncbi:MAG: phosphoglycerate dehydrogenase, partial [Saprospiraceae bacterium]
MDGKISFPKSLQARLILMNASKDDLDKLTKNLQKQVSNSITRNKDFFRKFADDVYIVSGGFKEYILPVVSKFGIKDKNVFGNKLVTNKGGRITGFDKNNLLSKPNGKIKQLRELNLGGDLYVIGDGYTDYELKKAGIAYKFFAFTENIERVSVTKNADYIAPSFDEFLYTSHLPMSISYPKNRFKVLLLENIHSAAKKIFKEEGYTVEEYKYALDENNLMEKIKDVSILGIRSKTQITGKVLSKAKKLTSIGAFCIGTNHIDIQAAALKGIPVFNAPFSNTRSVVELAIGEIIFLLRKIADKSKMLHQGIWDKSSERSYEVRGKKLGIIGYGKIGSQLSVLAEDLGMDVYYYDIIEKLSLGNAKRCNTLKELLNKADIVTVHVDGRKENVNFISDKEFKMMKDGTIFLNLSRGFIADIKSLAKNILSGKINGAAVDVFPVEPESNNKNFVTELQGLPNVILTPHIGGSTEEAQENIANFVPDKIISFINSGNSFFSVNFPNIQLPALVNAHRLIHIHENVPGILAKINGVLAKRKINIIGQYLKTTDDIGYVITDISKKYNPDVINELKHISHTIRFRVLY